MNVSGFQCIACGLIQPASFEGFVCPHCGQNLDVTYQYVAARSAFVNALSESAHGGLARYISLLPLASSDALPPLRVGGTPLYRAHRLGAQVGLGHLWLKDDGLNPSASFKDRAGAVALAVARERGARVIAGATTGNAGSSMACLAASVGQPCVIFVPETAPPAKLAQLLVFGATVLAVRGTYDQAFDLCAAVCRERGWFNRNTGSNPFTREGKKTVSYEIWEQLGRMVPDWVVVPTGDGNILSGVWKGWRDLYALGLVDQTPHLLCAQAVGSSAISRAVWSLKAERIRPAWRFVQINPVSAATLADSICVDVPRDGLAAVRAVIESDGAAVAVSDDDLLDAIPELAQHGGVFCEPAAACAWAGLRRAMEDGLIQKHDTVVCLLTGNGLKDIHAAQQSVSSPLRVRPDLKDALDLLSKRGL